MSCLEIFLVVDEPESTRTLRRDLESHGCRIETRIREKTDPGSLARNPSPLVLLSVETQAAGALGWCRDLKMAMPDCRLCVIFDRRDETQLIVALEMGADAVLVQPVSPRYLTAQLNSLARNAARQSVRSPAFDLRIRENSRDAVLSGRVLDLTDAEFDLLHLLLRHRGRILSREIIRREIRGLPHDSRDRSIDLNVVRLRRKMGDDAQSPRFIKTVRGQGYMLMAADL
jgi:two-component system, OmpR family, response regulator RstA